MMKSQLYKGLFTATCLVLILSTTSFGQDEESSIDSVSLDDMYIDFAVPELSAFSMLDVQGEEIARPGSVKKFAVSLASVLNNTETIKPGFALEFSPTKIAKNRGAEWWDRSFRWDNLAFTMATGSQDTLGVLGAIGLKWVPIDNTMPRGSKDKKFFTDVFLRTHSSIQEREAKYDKEVSDFQDYIIKLCDNKRATAVQIMNASFDMQSNDINEDVINIKKDKQENPETYLSNKMYQVLKEQGILVSSADSNEIYRYATKYVVYLQDQTGQDKTRKVLESLKAKYKKENWYKSSLLVNVGMVAAFPENKWERARFNNFSGIVSGAIPVVKVKEYYSQLLLQGKLDVATSDTVEFDSKYSFGSRFIVGNADNRVSLEGLYSSTQLDDAFTRNGADQIRYYRISLGLELKVLDDTWLEIAIGNNRYLEGENGTEIMPNFGFKHAFQSKKRSYNK